MEEVFERRRSSATLSTPCNNHCSAQNLLRATTGDFYLYSEACRSLGELFFSATVVNQSRPYYDSLVFLRSCSAKANWCSVR